MRPFEISRTFIAVICAVMLFNAGAGEAAQKLCVDPANTAKCSATIQAAVNKAKTIAVITIVAGTFDEHVVINSGAKPKSLTLVIQGAGAGNTIVDGSNAASSSTSAARPR